jgi:hypothetical protein
MAIMTDVEQLVEQMLSAAAGPLKAGGPKVLGFARTQFAEIAQTIAAIKKQTSTGEISQAEATFLLDMQEQASRAALATVEGMSLIMAEQAINAALNGIKDVINTAVRFPLIA